jgi:polyhydroxybutyrate depolymerase
MMKLTGRVPLTALVLMATCGPIGAEEPARLASQSLTVGGLTRDFVYFEPPAIGEGRPLVIVFHGGTGNGRQVFGRNLGSRWIDAAEVNRFWVVAPNGKPFHSDATGRGGRQDQRNWNGCRGLTEATGDGGYFPTNTGMSDWDDVGFVEAIIDWFADNKAVDRSRVYATGASSGGYMTLRLAQERPGLLAGYAPNIAMQPRKSECDPPDVETLRGEGRTMLFLYADRDELVPAGGGCVAEPLVGDCREGEVLDVAETLRIWKDWWGITSSGPEQPQPDRVADDHSRQYWTDHFAGEDLKLRVVRVAGGGHSVPGDTQYDEVLRNGLHLGWRNLDIDHVRTTARFFGLCTTHPDCYP